MRTTGSEPSWYIWEACYVTVERERTRRREWQKVQSTAEASNAIADGRPEGRSVDLSIACSTHHIWKPSTRGFDAV